MGNDMLCIMRSRSLHHIERCVLVLRSKYVSTSSKKNSARQNEELKHFKQGQWARQITILACYKNSRRTVALDLRPSF